MTVKYKTLITTAGAAKFAAATAGGTKITLTQMAVGDGGGTLPVPSVSQTKLIGEKWRAALNKISVDARHNNYVVAELVIPPEVGGFWLREMGLYDADGTLVAVASMAESYKPELAEGSGRAQTLRMVIIVSAIESVDLTVDATMVMATQDYVDDKLAEHERSRRHPDATLTAKGFTQLSSVTDSTSEALAATPKAVKAAFDMGDTANKNADARLAKNNNLSDLQDKVKARVNLGLKEAAVLDVGATAGTVAAGDDARIVNALQKGNNLSDLSDKVASRSHLGLKNAALRDVGIASGNVLEVGAFGIGVAGKSYISNFDWQTYKFVGGEYLYIDTSTMKNTPSEFLYPAATFLELFTMGLSDNNSPTVLAVAAGHLSEFAPTKLTCRGELGSRSWRVNVLFEGARDLGTTNINDLNKTWNVGIFGQATTRTGLIEQGYPINEAGTLIVMPSAGGIVTQEYVTWQSRRRYVRSVNFDNSWRDWREYAINGDDVAFQDITANRNLNVPNGSASVGTDLTVGRNARVVGDTALQGKLDVTKGVASSDSFSLNPKESNPFRMTNEKLNFNGMVLIAAHACSWYNDGMAWGARRGSSQALDGWTIFYNGRNIFNVGIDGGVTTSQGGLATQAWVGGNYCTIAQRDALSNRISTIESGYVRGIRFGAPESANAYQGPGFSDVLGYVVTGVSNYNTDNIIDVIQRRPLQVNINGSWMNVGG